MAITDRTKKIRKQIIRDVLHHPNDIAQHISDIFNISRQAVNKHIKALEKEGRIITTGTTRNKVYQLGPVRDNSLFMRITPTLSEHQVYMSNFSWVTDGVPKNVSDIIFYGFTEIYNNAIDHSDGEFIYAAVHRDEKVVRIAIHDDGEGIFRRIKRLKELSDERQSIVELSKGKLTTDPDNHSGQGIFFTSRMFDAFYINSHEFSYGHRCDIDMDIMFDDQKKKEGTWVLMDIAIDSDRIDKDVFAEFTDNDDDCFAFNKTIIPVSLAKFGNENLVSRSQAKRLLTRIENFKSVIFDFTDVEYVGQAFTDEIFRVYARRNPDIHVDYIKANPEVEAWIKRAINT
jgi:predicted transcriptional regulator